MKPLFIGLLLAAAVVWIIALLQLAGPQDFGKKAELTSQGLLDSVPELPQWPVGPVELSRDPFPATSAPVPLVDTTTVSALTQVPETPMEPPPPPPPPPQLQGVIEGQPNLAMLSLGGKTEIVAPGTTVFGWTVKSVTANGAVVQLGKRVERLQPP